MGLMTSVLQDNVDRIRNKRIVGGRLTHPSLAEWTWDKAIDMVDTHKHDDYDWNRQKQRLGLNSFHNRGSAPAFAKEIVADMQKFFIDDHINLPDSILRKEEYIKGPQQITNIAFCGFGQFSGSYPRHKDSMDVLLVQVLNECKITIGPNEEPNEDEDTIINMQPGHFVWIPRGTWHQLEPTVSRVTFSFGVEGDADPKDYI